MLLAMILVFPDERWSIEVADALAAQTVARQGSHFFVQQGGICLVDPIVEVVLYLELGHLDGSDVALVDELAVNAARYDIPVPLNVLVFKFEGNVLGDVGNPFLFDCNNTAGLMTSIFGGDVDLAGAGRNSRYQTGSTDGCNLLVRTAPNHFLVAGIGRLNRRLQLTSLIYIQDLARRSYGNTCCLDEKFAGIVIQIINLAR